MNFDSFIEDLYKEAGKVNANPDIIAETIAYGASLINIDYLSKIKTIPKLKKYIADYKEMNLQERGWKFQFGSSKEWAGLCSAASGMIGKSKHGKNIYVSIQYTKHDLNWKQNMRDVILHEISHAIIFEIFHFDKKHIGHLHRLDDQHKETDGHGALWKAVTKKLAGHELRIKLETAVLAPAIKNFKYECGSCQHIGYGDQPKFTNVCEKCKRPVFAHQNLA